MFICLDKLDKFRHIRPYFLLKIVYQPNSPNSRLFLKTIVDNLSRQIRRWLMNHTLFPGEDCLNLSRLSVR